jgi:hypothetical protein
MEVRREYCRLIAGRPERPKVAESLTGLPIAGAISLRSHFAMLSLTTVPVKLILEFSKSRCMK